MSATHRAIETTAIIIIIIIIINFLTVSEACKGVFSNRVRAFESFHSPQTGLVRGDKLVAPPAGEVRGDKLVAPHRDGSEGRQSSDELPRLHVAVMVDWAIRNKFLPSRKLSALGVR